MSGRSWMPSERKPKMPPTVRMTKIINTGTGLRMAQVIRFMAASCSRRWPHVDLQTVGDLNQVTLHDAGAHPPALHAGVVAQREHIVVAVLNQHTGQRHHQR